MEISQDYELRIAVEYFRENFPEKDAVPEHALAWIRLSLPEKLWQSVLKARQDYHTVQVEAAQNYQIAQRLEKYQRLMDRNRDLLKGLEEFDLVVAENQKLQDNNKALKLDLDKKQNAYEDLNSQTQKLISKINAIEEVLHPTPKPKPKTNNIVRDNVYWFDKYGREYKYKNQGYYDEFDDCFNGKYQHKVDER